MFKDELKINVSEKKSENINDYEFCTFEVSDEENRSLPEENENINNPVNAQAPRNDIENVNVQSGDANYFAK